MKGKIIISTIVLAIIVVGIFMLQSNTEKKIIGKPLRVTLHLWPGYYHSFIAQEQGFFRDEGVNLELTLIEDVDANLKAFVDGRADAAFGLQSDAMLLFAQGVELKIVYIADFSNGGDVVISKPDIQTVSELRGKTVSVDKLNSFNHIFLAELLRLNGLTESEVNIVPVKARDVPAALAAGKIDAGQTWEPYKSKALAQGYRLLATSADAPGIITDVLMVKKDVIEQREEDVRGFVKALFKALEFRESSPNISYAIMADATNVPPGILRDTIQSGNIFPNLEENKQAFRKTEQPISLYKSGEIISKFFLEKGIIKNPINLNLVHGSEIVNGIK